MDETLAMATSVKDIKPIVVAQPAPPPEMSRQLSRNAKQVQDLAVEAENEKLNPSFFAKGRALRKASQAMMYARKALVENEEELEEGQTLEASVFHTPSQLPVQPTNWTKIQVQEGLSPTASPKPAELKETGVMTGAWKRPYMWYQADGFMATLIDRIPRVHQRYIPPVWMAGGTCHLLCATVWRTVIHPLAPWSTTREEIKTPDGGTLSLDWFRGFLGPIPHTVKRKASTPIVLVLHAFAGNSKESYCLTALRAASKKGWRAASMNYRGCGGTPLTSARPFSVAASNDVYTVVTHIKKQYPKAPVFMIGYSIGAYTLTKYLAEVDSGQLPTDGRLAGAMCCGSGFDYQAEMNKITAPGGKVIDFDWIERVYWNMYVSEFKDALQKNPAIDWAGMKTAKTVTELEGCIIPATWGFKDMTEYYESFNALKLIPNIRTPTLFFSAEDDPFLDMSVAPLSQVQQSPYTAFALTKEGGHCGHLILLGWLRGLSMIDQVLQQMVEAILKLSPEEKAKMDLDYEEWRAAHPFDGNSKIMQQLRG